jgi:hypothetical protein
MCVLKLGVGTGIGVTPVCAKTTRGRLPAWCSVGRTIKRALGMMGVVVCMVAASSCSGSTDASVGSQPHKTLVSRPAPKSHVLLVPHLVGGIAGWCMATVTETAIEGSAGCGPSMTSTGPIFDESCSGNDTKVDIFALTMREVAAVSVAGGTPIPTASNSTLPEGLRAVAIELLGYKWLPEPPFTHPCPQMTPFDIKGRPIRRLGKRGTPLAFRLPVRQWELSAHPPRGVCQLTATRPPRETVADSGAVALQIGRFPQLIGRAFLTCIHTTYIYREENHLRAAILLDASHPGATPSSLPDMKSLTGHPGIFEAPGSGGEMVARRIPGAWLVVEESDGIGIHVPLELLKRLRATIHL